jgi:hypothetical protein
MTTRTASCRCGQLRVMTEGDPGRVSVCHCLACQKRTGSTFSAQGRWSAEWVTIEGRSSSWTRTAASGQQTVYNFCPDCGSTVHYSGGNFPDVIAVPLGAFDDPYFTTPDFSVWERRRHDWVEIFGPDVQHSD